MFFQKVLKGINGLSRQQATEIVQEGGILCNWWRNKNHITNPEVKEELTEVNLIHHLNDYDLPLPQGHRWLGLNGSTTYGDVSAFISLTAGSVQRDASRSLNVLYPPFMTALNFATQGFTTDGYLFYAYVMTLGTQAIELQGFAEEVRELHIYTRFLPFHHEGEITAKICVPSVNIEKAEYYNGPQALNDLRRNALPQPSHVIQNPDYVPPDNYANIRELL